MIRIIAVLCRLAQGKPKICIKKQSVIAVAVILFSAFGHADELIMNNGSRIIGRLVSADGGEVVFNTPFAGDLTVAEGDIKHILTDTNVTLLMKDGNSYKDKRIVMAEEGLAAISDDEPPIRFEVLDIDMVNPQPWQLGEGYKWFGDANTVVLLERGNTDSDQLDLDFKSIWRSLVDRYTVRGAMEFDEANGEKNKNNRALRNKYDRFSEQDSDNYWGAQAVFQYDEFADLDLRTTVGPYLGRQFYESGLLTLSGEVGAVYVDERFDVAQDNDFFGANWELNLTSDIIPRTKLYVEQFGVLNFDEVDGVIIDTIVGIKLPIVYGFQAAVEAKFEYDGGAVEGVDDLDETYNFKIGYSW